jgi:hypothetical protein
MRRLLSLGVLTVGSVACNSGEDSVADAGAIIDSVPPVKRVFVTSSQYDGDLARLGGGDKLCQQIATDARLGGTWKAWLSIGGVSAVDRISDVAPWFLIDGVTKVFATKAQLRARPTVIINQDESGMIIDPMITAPRDLVVETGTRNGGLSGADCGAWTNTGMGTYGFLDLPEYWTEYADGICDIGSNKRLYCFEQ